MYPHTNASPLDKLNFDTVLDLIYNPSETLLLKNARLLNKKCVNGMYMLISQGLCSQSIWNNTEIEKDIIEKIYNEVK